MFYFVFLFILQTLYLIQKIKIINFKNLNINNKIIKL